MINPVLAVKIFLLGFERACRTGNIKTMSFILGPALLDRYAYYHSLCYKTIFGIKLADFTTKCFNSMYLNARYNSLRFLALDAYYECSDSVRRLLGGATAEDRYLFHMPGRTSRPINTLCAAAGLGHLHAVKLLYNWRYLKNNRIRNQHLALILACKNGHPLVVEYLVAKRGVNADEVDQGCGSPLYVARHQVDVTEVLLKNGAKVNVILFDGSTLLLKAVTSKRSSEDKRVEMVSLLLQYGADVNLAHAFSWETPLMVAALAGRFEIVDVLLKHGADVTQKKYDGRTVLDMLRLNYDENTAYTHILVRCQEYIETNRPTYKTILK